MNVDDLIGVPFAHGGRCTVGMDCYGLLLEVFRRHGIDLPDPFAGVARGWGKDEPCHDPHGWIQAMFGNWIKGVNPQPGVAVGFSRFHRVVDHCGVMLDDVRFIHAVEKIGVCVSRIDRPPWGELVTGFYAYGPDPL